MLNSTHSKFNFNRIKGLAISTIWQMIPAFSSALLSVIVVNLFSFEAWGKLVAIVAIQQIFSILISWGNKDFLQKKFGNSPSEFKTIFSQNFYSRAVFLLLVPLLLIFPFEGDLSIFFWITLLVVGRFIQQSTEVLVLINKKFFIGAVIDCSILLCQIIAIYYTSLQQNESYLLPILACGVVVRGVGYWLLFRAYFYFSKFDFQSLRLTFPFALLAITGFLISRVDLLVLASLVNAEILGKYQIIIALLYNLQAIANYISAPYTHHFYKSDSDLQQKLKRVLLKAGVIILPIALLSVFVVLNVFYKLVVPYYWFIPMYIFSIASFIYIPAILDLYQHNNLYTVLVINIAANLFVISLLFTSSYFTELTVFNLLWIMALYQVVLTMGYWISSKVSFFQKQFYS